VDTDFLGVSATFVFDDEVASRFTASEPLGAASPVFGGGFFSISCA
jgi:hypothetical protein